jgi:hypothetical protein
MIATDGDERLAADAEALPPNWPCAQEHRWRDDDSNAWEEQLLTVLVAHGYNKTVDEP